MSGLGHFLTGFSFGFSVISFLAALIRYRLNHSRRQLWRSLTIWGAGLILLGIFWLVSWFWNPNALGPVAAVDMTVGFLVFIVFSNLWGHSRRSA